MKRAWLVWRLFLVSKAPWWYTLQVAWVVVCLPDETFMEIYEAERRQLFRARTGV